MGPGADLGVGRKSSRTPNGEYSATQRSKYY